MTIPKPTSGHLEKHKTRTRSRCPEVGLGSSSCNFLGFLIQPLDAKKCHENFDFHFLLKFLNRPLDTQRCHENFDFHFVLEFLIRPLDAKVVKDHRSTKVPSTKRRREQGRRAHRKHAKCIGFPWVLSTFTLLVLFRNDGILNGVGARSTFREHIKK